MSAPSGSSPSRPAWIALAALLAALALAQLVRSFDPGSSVDFYQFWGVGAARARQPDLPTPWSRPEAYRAALEERFADEPRADVRRVHRYRMAAFEPFGSPLLYLAFAPLPDDYVVALALYQVLQVVAFAGGVWGLARLGAWALHWALILPSVLVLAYRPFADDLLTGNVNALQLGALALVGVAAGRPAASPEARIRRGGAVLVAATALVLFKANLAAASAGLALSLGLRLGARGFARACARAVPGVLVLVAAPCLYFGAARAWLDWCVRVFAAEPSRLADYAVAAGNTSTPRLLDELLGLPVLVSAALVATLLAASLAWVPRGAWRDPRLGVGLGIVLALAAAPLVWFHYFVLALVPGLWLVGSPQAGLLPRVLAGAALAIAAGPYLPLVPRAALPALYVVWSLLWIPLWSALLVRARRAPTPGDPDAEGAEASRP
jgi:hypothetical protein